MILEGVEGTKFRAEGHTRPSTSNWFFEMLEPIFSGAPITIRFCPQQS